MAKNGLFGISAEEGRNDINTQIKGGEKKKMKTKAKKAIYVIGIIALITAIMVMPASAVFEPYECDVYVHEGESIQSAINSASPGNTICVYNGTYSSQEISINKPNIEVIGEGADVVTVDFGGYNGFYMPYGNPGHNASGSVLDGFKVVNSLCGVVTGRDSYPASDCIIRNCVFDGMSGEETLTLKAGNLTFENNVVNLSGTKSAARLEGKSSRVIDNVFINSPGSWCALYIRKGADFSKIINNTFINSAGTRAITIKEANNCTVINNTFIDNTGDAIRIWKISATDNTITRNNISSNGGIICLKDAGGGNKIYLNDFVDNPAGVTYSGTPPTVTYWNSTEPIEYVCPTDGETYTNYLGNYWSDHPGGAEDGCGIWATAYGIPPASPVDYDYRPLMQKFENYLGEAPAQPEPNATVYLVPENSSAAYCNEVEVEIWANTSDPYLAGGTVNLTYDAGCANVTNFAGNTGAWEVACECDSSVDGRELINFASKTTKTGEVLIGTLTVHCVNEDYCTTGLKFDDGSMLTSKPPGESAVPIVTAWEDGKFVCANAPDLVVSSKSEEWINMADKTYKVHYTVKNEGNANAGVSNVSLTVDGVEKETKQVSALAQGAEESGTFDTVLTMSGDDDVILVCADCNDEVFEFNEENNCMENEWTSALKVDIGDYVVTPGSTVKAPITIYGMQNYGTGTISVSFDKTVAQVTNVESSSDSTVTDSNIDNSAGVVTTSAWNLSGTSGDVIFAYVTFKAVGTSGSSTALDLTVSSLQDTSFMDISTYTENGSLTITEDAPPVVSEPTAASDTILNDNGRARVPGTNVSRLSVHIADTAGVGSVTVNLAPIWGPGNGNDSVSMTRTAGDDQSGTWSLNVTATYDAGVDQTHCLAVNATDVSGNSNTAKCILLTVLRRGDVNVGLAHDNDVNMGDALYIARYTVGKEPAPDPFVADVVGAGGAADSYNGVDMGDALYIARYTVGKEVAP